jgi:hypothetical protein
VDIWDMIGYEKIECRIVHGLSMDINEYVRDTHSYPRKIFLHIQKDILSYPSKISLR